MGTCLAIEVQDDRLPRRSAPKKQHFFIRTKTPNYRYRYSNESDLSLSRSRSTNRQDEYRPHRGSSSRRRSPSCDSDYPPRRSSTYRRDGFRDRWSGGSLRRDGYSQRRSFGPSDGRRDQYGWNIPYAEPSYPQYRPDQEFTPLPRRIPAILPANSGYGQNYPAQPATGYAQTRPEMIDMGSYPPPYQQDIPVLGESNPALGRSYSQRGQGQSLGQRGGPGQQWDQRGRQRQQFDHETSRNAAGPRIPGQVRPRPHSQQDYRGLEDSKFDEYASGDDQYRGDVHTVYSDEPGEAYGARNGAGDQGRDMAHGGRGTPRHSG